jgi:hypothetical protein
VDNFFWSCGHNRVTCGHNRVIDAFSVDITGYVDEMWMKLSNSVDITGYWIFYSFFSSFERNVKSYDLPRILHLISK